MNFIMLLLASITTVLFLVNLARGKQYGYMVESLDGGEYFLKELYVVGFSLNDGATGTMNTMQTLHGRSSCHLRFWLFP